MKTVFATNNQGKLNEVIEIAKEYGIQIHAPSDFGIENVEVVEDGDTFEANALKKWYAYKQALQEMGSISVMLIADDGGLEIDFLGGKPGVLSRRWRDGVNEMTDQDMIDYCLEQLAGASDDNRSANFTSAMAYGSTIGQPETIRTITAGEIVKIPVMSSYVQGFPFRALFRVPEMDMMLQEIAELLKEERQGFMSHREKALREIFKLS